MSRVVYKWSTIFLQMVKVILDSKAILNKVAKHCVQDMLMLIYPDFFSFFSQHLQERRGNKKIKYIYSQRQLYAYRLAAYFAFLHRYVSVSIF
jgi:hypothetical protein